MANLPDENQHEIVLVGAGIAGLATALALKIVGIPSLVLERHYELRTTGAGLNLSPNAWRALEVLGVAEKLFQVFEPLEKVRAINIENGASRTVSVTAGTANSIKNGRRGILPVLRKTLLETLAEELPKGAIRFNSKLVSIKKEQNGASHPITIHLDDGTILRTKVLIGCDGVHSVVAQWLGLSQPIHSGRSAIRGLSIFPEGHGLKKEVVQFLGNGKRGGLIPLNDKEVLWFITHFSTPKEKEVGGDPELILKELIQNLAKDFPPEYHNMLNNYDINSISWAPLMLRKPWDVVFNKLNDGCVTVVGDAMHPMTPDLGQGGCQALEDAIVLARNIALARKNGDAHDAQAIEKYINERKWRTAMICAGAYLSGWVQQGGVSENGWLSSMVVKLRDIMFYTMILPRVTKAVLQYDCGDLPLSGDYKVGF